MEAGKTDIGWGHQIRSYVLQPYQMVKDLRTSVEKGNPAAVLDGELDEFMAAALAQRVGATRSEASASALSRPCDPPAAAGGQHPKGAAGVQRPPRCTAPGDRAPGRLSRR